MTFKVRIRHKAHSFPVWIRYRIRCLFYGTMKEENYDNYFGRVFAPADFQPGTGHYGAAGAGCHFGQRMDGRTQCNRHLCVHQIHIAPGRDSDGCGIQLSGCFLYDHGQCQRGGHYLHDGGFRRRQLCARLCLPLWCGPWQPGGLVFPPARVMR